MAQLIDLGKLRFYWAGEYSGSTVYEVNDVVKYGGNVYVYTNTTSASGNLPTATDYWALMISGLKFEGEYNDATSYQVGDGVAYGGIVYIAVADTTGNEPPNVTYWSQFADGIQYEASYSGSTAYQLNDVVTYGGKAYIAKQLTSGNVPTNATYWDVFTEGVRGLGVYNNSTTYLPGDVVSYGGNVYINTATSTGNIPTNTSYWNIMSSGIKYIGAYSGSTAYKINEIVTYGAKMYVAKGATTGNLPTDATYWDQLVDGISAEGVYNNGTAYVPGDVVAYGPNLYIAIDETTGNIPTNATYWTKFVDSISSAGAYSAGTTYYIGNVVRYGAYLYICKLQSTGNLPTNTTYWDLFVSSLASLGAYNSGTTYTLGDIVRYGANLYINKLQSTGNIPTNTTYWDLFTASIESSGAWDSGTTYYTNAIVTYGPNTYIALRETVGDAPDVSTSDWSLFAEGLNLRGNWATSTLYYINDIVVRGGSTYICILKHSSSADFATDLAASKWTKFNGGIRWRGEWQTSTAYLVDDVVYAGVTSYIATADFTSDATSFENDTDWDVLALGADFLPSQLGNAGKFLSTNGSNAVWASSGSLDSLTINDGLEINGDTVSHGDLVVSNRSVNVTNKIRTNNVVTLTTDEEHFFDTGDVVIVDLSPDTALSGTFTIGATPTATTFTYTASGANVGSTVVTPAGTANVIGNVNVTAGNVVVPKITVNANASVGTTLSVGTDLTVGDQAFVGTNAAAYANSAALTAPIAVFVENADSYVQISVHNESDGASASSDFLAYADNGDDASGWIDMGITSSEFEDLSFTVTGKNDGYIFMSAPTPAEFDVDNKALTNNVATLTTSTAHSFTTGDIVVVADVDATFDGEYTITGTTSNTFTYAKTAANVASAAVSPTGTATVHTGEGNLVLATDGTGRRNKIIFAAGGLASNNEQMAIVPDQGVHIEINTASSSANTGALVVEGGVGFAGDISGGEDLRLTGISYVGSGAEAFNTAAGLTDPMGVFNITGGANSYAQVSVHNATNTSSTDMIVYASNGDDTSGWIDLGVTGEAFDQSTFGITGPNDGYIFYEAPAGTTGAGNLVFATGANGTENKIVFAAGGFDSGTTQMEITPAVNVHIEINTPSTSATTGALTVVGGVGVLGDMNVQGNVNVEGTITFGGGGTTVTTANLSVTDPFVFIGNGNQADILDLGLIAEHTVAVSAITATVENKALTNNVVTLTTGTAHTYREGDVVVVSGVDATLNGTYSITGTTSNTFTYAKTAANVASAAVTPSGSASVSARRVFAGVTRDATDGIVKFFDNAVTKPTTTINFSEAGLTYVDILAKNINASGTLTSTGDFIVGANTMNVIAATGNTTVGGTMNVTGAVTLSNTLAVTGVATLNGGINSSGTLTLTGGANLSGTLDVQELREQVVNVTPSSNNANVAWTDGNIYYINAQAATNSITLNITGVPTDNDKIMTVNLLFLQGSTGRVPATSFTINGSAASLRWVGGAAPTPTSSSGKIDIFSITFLRTGSAFIPLASSSLNF
jgi:hypothetical protein